jgi:hypothetical protein
MQWFAFWGEIKRPLIVGSAWANVWKQQQRPSNNESNYFQGRQSTHIARNCGGVLQSAMQRPIYIDSHNGIRLDIYTIFTSKHAPVWISALTKTCTQKSTSV